MSKGGEPAPKPPQKKAGTTVSRVVDPNAWQHADEDHPGTAEPVAGAAEPVAISAEPVTRSDAPGDD